MKYVATYANAITGAVIKLELDGDFNSQTEAFDFAHKYKTENELPTIQYILVSVCRDTEKTYKEEEYRVRPKLAQYLVFGGNNTLSEKEKAMVNTWAERVVNGRLGVWVCNMDSIDSPFDLKTDSVTGLGACLTVGCRFIYEVAA